MKPLSRSGLRTPTRAKIGFLCALVLGSWSVPSGVAGQGSDAGDGVRFGLTVGGISTVGVAVEFFRDSRSIDITLGTWAFRDVSLSVVGKQYIGGRDLRPFVGLGLWLVLARPADQRTGLGLVARAPVGLDWEAAESHSIGAAVSANRALAVRRPDPDDDLPLAGRLVPLPGMYYRWTR